MPHSGLKRAFVAGATGGLGREVTFQLARIGYELLLHGRDGGKLKALSARLELQGLARPTTFVADFTSLSSVAAMAAQVEQATDQVDLLVNAAGMGFSGDNLVTEDGYRLTTQVNYLAPYLLMHRFLPLMAHNRAAKVLNVASAGQADLTDSFWDGADSPDAIAYGQSKLALIMASRTLADELAGEPPEIVALHPGSLLNTELTQALLRRMPRWVTLAWRLSRPLRPSVESAAEFIAAVATKPEGAQPPLLQSAKGPCRVRPQAQDASVRARLEAFSRDATGVFLGETKSTHREGEVLKAQARTL
jgi:NAD(P)-dependent dehydrogenase (short-subunit alcohol dehydrogenase family)